LADEKAREKCGFFTAPMLYVTRQIYAMHVAWRTGPKEFEMKLFVRSILMTGFLLALPTLAVAQGLKLVVTFIDFPKGS
jgi:hypothetical protein